MANYKLATIDGDGSWHTIDIDGLGVGAWLTIIPVKDNLKSGGSSGSLLLAGYGPDVLVGQIGTGAVFAVGDSYDALPTDEGTLRLATNGACGGETGVLVITDTLGQVSHQGPIDPLFNFASSDSEETAGRISLHTGEKRLSETDLALATPAGPLTFTRSFRQGAMDVHQFMGCGWTHNHHLFLRLFFTLETTRRFELTLPHGGLGYYAEYEDVGWFNSPGAFGLIQSSSSVPGFELELPDLSSWVFEATSDPNLFRIKERIWSTGETWIYTYHPGSDNLQRVEDGHDRYLEFEYWETGDHAGQLKLIKDHKDRTVQLNYELLDGNSVLTEVVDILDRGWTYHYYGQDSGENSPDLRGFLTKRISPLVDTTGNGTPDSSLTLERLTYQPDEPIDIFDNEVRNGDLETTEGWHTTVGMAELSSGPSGQPSDGNCWHVNGTIESDPFRLIGGTQYTISAKVYNAASFGSVQMRLAQTSYRKTYSTTLENWEQLTIDVFVQEADEMDSIRFIGNDFYVDEVSVIEKHLPRLITHEMGITGAGSPLLKTELEIRADDRNVTLETIGNRVTSHYFARGVYAGVRDADGNVASRVDDGSYHSSAVIDGNLNVTRFSYLSQFNNKISKATNALLDTTRWHYGDANEPTNDLLLGSVDSRKRQTFYLYENTSQPRWPTKILSGSRSSNLIQDGTIDLDFENPDYPWQPIASHEPTVFWQDDNLLYINANADCGIESSSFPIENGVQYLAVVRLRVTFGQAQVEIIVDGESAPIQLGQITTDEWQTLVIPYVASTTGTATLQFTALSGVAEFYIAAVGLFEPSGDFQWEELEYNDSGLILSHALLDPADGTTILRKVTNTYHETGDGEGLLATTSVHDNTDDLITLTRSFEYNEYGLVAKITDETGAVKLIGYDPGGRVVRVVESASTPAYLFSNDLKLSSYPVTYSPDKDVITDYVYDTLGRLIETKTGVGTFVENVSQLRRDLTVYDAMGRVVRTIENYVPGVSSPYTALRTPALSANPLDPFQHGENNDRNLVTDIIYNDRGLVSKKVDPAGVVTLIGYDDADRVVKTIHNASNPSYPMSYEDGDPDLSAYRASTDSDKDIITTFEYDPAGNLVKSVDPMGNVSFTVYDALNRPVKSIQSAKSEATITREPGDYNYVAGNDPRSVDYVASTLPDKDIILTRVYDAVGNVVKTVDPLGNIAFVIYDDLDRVVKTVRNAKDTATISTDPDAPDYIPGDDPRSDWYAPSTEADRDIITKTVYEDALRMQHTEDPVGVQTWFAYDGFNRVVETILNPSSDPRLETYMPSDDPDKDIITRTVYNTNGQILEAIDPLDRKTHFGYDAMGRVINTTANYVNGVFNEYAPDEDVVSSVTYIKQGWVRQEIDPLSNSTFHTYDVLGRRNKTVVNYSRGQRGNSTTDLDRVTTISYGLDSQPVSIVDPAGVETRFEYDTARRRVQTIANYKEGALPNQPDMNVITQTAYNKAGQVVSVTDPRGAVATIQYDAALRPRAQTRPNGAVDWTCYDKAGQVTRMIQNVSYRPGDEVMPDHQDSPGEWAYNPQGHGELEDRDLISVTQRDQAGRVISATDPIGHTTQMIYNKAGLLLSSTDPAGVETRYVYDGVHRLRRVVRAYVGSGGIDPDPVNWVWDSGEKRWEDGSGNALPHGTRNDQNIITDLKLDKANRQKELIDANGNTMTYDYDDLDRQESVIDPLGQLWQTKYVPLRDSGTLQVVTTDPGSHQVTRDMDRLGRLWKITYADANTPNVKYSYDLRGDLTKMAEGSGGALHETFYGYDSLHHMTYSFDYALGQGVTYKYDAGGLRTKMSPAIGPEINYIYNDSGQLKRIQGDVWGTDFLYDGVDRLATVARDNGLRSHYTYDAASRLTRLAHQNATKTFGSFEYERDSLGNPKLINEYVPIVSVAEKLLDVTDAKPKGGDWQLVGDFQVATEPGSMLRLGAVHSRNVVLTLGTGPDHGLCDIMIGTGRGKSTVATVNTHAATSGERQFGVDLKAEGPKRVFIRSKKYLSYSKLRYKSALFLSAASDNQAVTYDYDALSRPYHVDISTPSGEPGLSNKMIYDFVYDRMGHLKHRHSVFVGPPTIVDDAVLTYDSHEYRLENQGTLEDAQYDSGNMVSDGLMEYTWDRANRLTQVEGGGQTFKHVYNGLGQRINLTQNSVPTRFLYDGMSQFAIGATDNTETTTRFLIGPLGIHAQQTDGSPWIYPIMDGLGNIRGVVENGTQIENKQYSPIGNLELGLSSGTRYTPFGFDGGQDDPSGLNYLFTSYYHPGIGQALSFGPWDQFRANFKILSDYAGNPDNPLGWRIALSLLAGVYAAPYAVFAVNTLVLAAPAWQTVAGLTLIGAGVGMAVGYYQQGAYTNPNAQIDRSRVLQSTLAGAEFGFMMGLGYSTGLALEGAVSSGAITASQAAWYGGALNVGTGVGWDMIVHGQSPSEALLWNVAGFGIGEAVGYGAKRLIRGATGALLDRSVAMERKFLGGEIVVEIDSDSITRRYIKHPFLDVFRRAPDRQAEDLERAFVKGEIEGKPLRWDKDYHKYGHTEPITGHIIINDKPEAIHEQISTMYHEQVHSKLLFLSKWFNFRNKSEIPWFVQRVRKFQNLIYQSSATAIFIEETMAENSAQLLAHGRIDPLWGLSYVTGQRLLNDALFIAGVGGAAWALSQLNPSQRY